MDAFDDNGSPTLMGLAGWARARNAVVDPFFGLDRTRPGLARVEFVVPRTFAQRLRDAWRAFRFDPYDD